MKSKILILVLIGSLTGISSKAQFAFSVSPGLSLNGAGFGYKIGEKIMPYIGLQYMNVSINNTMSVSGNSFTSNVKAGLLLPNLGMKYYVVEKNKLKAFGNVNLSKPFLSGKATINGVEDEAFKEIIKSISLWGGELSFGAEYAFDENFSIGGEFGLRLLFAKTEQKSSVVVIDPVTGSSSVSEASNEIKVRTNPTFTRISLNYYF